MATLEARIKAMLDLLGPDIKALVAADKARPIKTVAVSYTLLLADAGYHIEGTSASATTVTVPLNSAAAFPVGTFVEFTQMGAGQITFAPTAGVTLASRGAALKMAGQYSVAFLRKSATDTWVLTGDLVT